MRYDVMRHGITRKIQTKDSLFFHPQEVNDEDDGSEFEVVFISSDDDEAAAHKYLQEMHANWLMLPYDAPLRQELKRKLRVFGAKEQDV
jgi:hypothetical protein